MPTRRGKWTLVALGTMGLLINQAQAAPRDAASPPDTDFLEFLGSWHTGDGKWVDPFQVDDSPVLEANEPAQSPTTRDPHDQSRSKRLEQDPSVNENQPASPPPRSDVTP